MTAFSIRTTGEECGPTAASMLDLCVYAIGFSPAFTQDETIFAALRRLCIAAATGRAPERASFPEEALPVLVRRFPNFVQDQTLLAGTDHAGLHLTTDGGRQWWRKGSLPAATVNALVIAPDRQIYAATETGVFQSEDGGDTWQCLVDIPNSISLASAGGVTMAGFVDQGVWAGTHRSGWKALPLPPARSMLGFALSSQFDETAPNHVWRAGWHLENHGRWI
jgi:hypothetical protein